MFLYLFSKINSFGKLVFIPEIRREVKNLINIVNMLHKHEIYFSDISEKLEKKDVEILYDIHKLIQKSDNNLKEYECYISKKIFEDEDLFLQNESLIKKGIIDLADVVSGVISEIETNKKKQLKEEEEILEKEDKKINDNQTNIINNNHKKIKYSHNDLLDSDISSDN